MIGTGGTLGTVDNPYDSAHRKARRHLARRLPAPCGYCSEIIQPGDLWHAAHRVDGDPTEGWMVAHPACNERAKIARSVARATVITVNQSEARLNALHVRRLRRLAEGFGWSQIGREEGIAADSVRNSILAALRRRGVVIDVPEGERPSITDLREAARQALTADELRVERQPAAPTGPPLRPIAGHERGTR